MLLFAERTILHNTKTSLNSLIISKNGRIVTPFVGGGSIWKHRVRDTSNIYQVGTVTVFGAGPILTGEMTPDETQIFVAGSSALYKGIFAGDVLNGQAGAYLASIVGARAVRISPDGVYLAIGFGDGTFRVWNLATKTLLVTIPHGFGITDVRWTPDGNQLVIAPRLRVINRSGDTFTDGGLVTGGTDITHGIRVSNDGQHVVGCSAANTTGPAVVLFKKSGSSYVAVANPFDDGGITTRAVQDLCYSNDGAFLFFGRSLGTPDVRIYSRNGDAYVRQVDPPGIPQELIQTVNWAAAAPRLAYTIPVDPFFRIFDYTEGAAGKLVGYQPTVLGRANVAVGFNATLNGLLPTVVGSGKSPKPAYGDLNGLLPKVAGTLKAPKPARGNLFGILPTVSGQAKINPSVYGNPKNFIPGLYAYVSQTNLILGNGNGLPVWASGLLEIMYNANGDLQSFLPGIAGVLQPPAVEPPDEEVPAAGGAPNFSTSGDGFAIGGGPRFNYGNGTISL